MKDYHIIAKEGFDDKILYQSFYHPEQPFDRRRRAGWILSFTDLMAILLSFFVLLFSMSSPSQSEWQVISGAFGDGFNKLERQLVGYAGPNDALNISLSRDESGQDLDYVQTVLEGLLTRLPQDIAKDITITRYKDRIVIFAPVLLRFDGNSATLSPQAKAMISRFAQILKAFDNSIEILGRMSNEDMKEASYDLALDRAIVVARYLTTRGLSQNPTVLALAQDEDSGNAQNIPEIEQRVDIVILRERKR